MGATAADESGIQEPRSVWYKEAAGFSFEPPWLGAIHKAI